MTDEQKFKFMEHENKLSLEREERLLDYGKELLRQGMSLKDAEKELQFKRVIDPIIEKKVAEKTIISEKENGEQAGLDAFDREIAKY